MKKIFLIILFGLIFTPFLSVRAEEILQYDVDIEINKDASVNVKEKILYDFGENEHHGIHREIPVEYLTNYGGKLKTKINKIRVSDENGNKLNFSVSNSGNYKRIKIGNAHKLISGKHWYNISYTIHNVITYFDDHQEFYWNATGDQWPVDINDVRATITAPKINQGICFAGRYGSAKECNFLQGPKQFEEKAKIIFGQDKLISGEGLTIVVGMPIGTIRKPMFIENILKIMSDNIILFLPFIIFGWAFNRWYKHGRDPKGRGTIVPYYDVPDDLSVAGASVVLHNGLRSKDISAMIIQLAVDGYLKIKKEKKGKIFKHDQYIFERTDKKSEGLDVVAKSLLHSLFKFGENGIVTTDDLKDAFYKKVESLKNLSLDEVKKQGYFPKNKTEFNGGTLILVGFIQMIVFGIVSTFFGSISIYVGFVNLGICIFFAVFMGHRTKKGVEMKEKLLGLKIYLETAEKDRIKFHNAPEKNPERFEKLLPFAMIFGVEREWAEQFKDIYKEQPEWYEGESAQIFNSVVLANSLNSFASTTSVSVTSSPSSASSGGSGFSGGGSGGGFGGGGGGSW